MARRAVASLAIPTAPPASAAGAALSDESESRSTGLGLTEAELQFLHETFDLARSGRTVALAERVDAGVPVNLTNDSGDTLLILAAYHAHPDTVRALLDRGADTTRVNDRGQTAVAAAVFRRSTDTVVTLLRAGADPATGGPSALDVATFFDLPDMLTLLRGGPPPQ